MALEWWSLGLHQETIAASNVHTKIKLRGMNVDDGYGSGDDNISISKAAEIHKLRQELKRQEEIAVLHAQIAEEN